MSDENEGLLAYFQRIITKLLASCTTETGFADVSDDYMASMILDSIDRTFLHGRKQGTQLNRKISIDFSIFSPVHLAFHDF